MTRVLAETSVHLKKSEFADKAVIPVVDPSNRTISVFAAGQMAKLDVKKCQAGLYDAYGTGVDMDAELGKLGVDVPGGDPDLTGLPGHSELDPISKFLKQIFGGYEPGSGRSIYMPGPGAKGG